MNLSKIKNLTDWVKMWSAEGSLTFDTHLGEVWTRDKNIADKPMYQQVIFVYRDGVTDCWATQVDRDDVGKRLVSLANENSNYISGIAEQLSVGATSISNFISSHDPAELNLNGYNEFWQLVYDYYLPHVSVKYIVDYITEDELERVLPVLESARKKAEPTYREIENYFALFADNVGRKVDYRKKAILATTKEEIFDFFSDKQLPSEEILEKRFSHSVLVCDDEDSELYLDGKAQAVEGILFQTDASNSLKGEVAYAGRIVGRVRVVHRVDEVKESFSEGEILVTGMTHPDFLPLVQKASAIITDSGGMLSHAAIVARELKKPCIVGTKTATQVLKDGDKVEVDADNGVVKILNRGE